MYMLILNYSNFMIQFIFVMNQLNAYICPNEIRPKLNHLFIYLFIYDQMTHHTSKME